MVVSLDHGSRRGCTPVLRVRGRGSGRVSMAGMTCYKAGERARLFYAVREYSGRRGQPKVFGWLGVAGQRGAQRAAPGLGGRSKRSHGLFTGSINPSRKSRTSTTPLL